MGQYALALAVNAPVFLLANLRLRTVFATDVSGRFQPGAYITVRLWTTLTAFSAIAAFGLARGTPIVAAVALLKAVESLSDLWYGVLQRRERMEIAGRGLIARGILGFLAFTAAALLSGPVAAVVSAAFTWALVFWFYERPSTGRITEPGDEGSYALVRSTIPLGIAAGLGSLYINIPRYWVEHALGTRQLAYFATLAALGLMATPVVGALCETASRRLAEELRAGSQSLLSLLLAGSGLLGAGGVLLAAVAGEPLLRWTYGPEYAVHAGLLVWLMLVGAAAHLASVMNYAVIAAGYFQSHTVLIIASTAAVLAGCFAFTGMGLYGAAAAMLCAMGLQTLGGAVVISYAVWRTRQVATHGA